MSTTFDVFPKTSFIPTFDELFGQSVINLHKYLTSIGVSRRLDISYKELRISDNKIVKSTTLKSQYITNTEHYVWIQLDGVEGGVDGYFDFTDKDILEELVEGRHVTEKHAEKINKDLTQDYYWSFRRSAGQPELINLFYGIISGTLAEITEGIVFSGDCAWEYESLPATGTDFLGLYMKPEKVINDIEFVKLARECISKLQSE